MSVSVHALLKLFQEILDRWCPEPLHPEKPFNVCYHMQLAGLPNVILDAYCSPCDEGGKPECKITRSKNRRLMGFGGWYYGEPDSDTLLKLISKGLTFEEAIQKLLFFVHPRYDLSHGVV